GFARERAAGRAVKTARHGARRTSSAVEGTPFRRGAAILTLMSEHTHKTRAAAPAVSAPSNGADSASAPRRVTFLLWVLATATLCGSLLSPNLWVSSRAYPLAPVWDGLPTIPHPWDWLWFGALLVLLAASAGLPRPSSAILSFVAAAGLLSLWDQTRW